MYFIEVMMGLLSVISVVCFVLGLIKPEMFAFLFGGTPSRLKTGFAFFCSSFVLMIIGSLVADHPLEPANQNDLVSPAARSAFSTDEAAYFRYVFDLTIANSIADKIAPITDTEESLDRHVEILDSLIKISGRPEFSIVQDAHAKGITKFVLFNSYYPFEYERFGLDKKTRFLIYQLQFLNERKEIESTELIEKYGLTFYQFRSIMLEGGMEMWPSPGIDKVDDIWAFDSEYLNRLPKSSASSKPTQQKEPEEFKDYSTEAFVMSEFYVKEKLVSPATADFPSMRNAIVFCTDSSNSTYQINSYVDSQNRMGALLRTNYICIIEYTGEELYLLENWKLIDLYLYE